MNRRYFLKSHFIKGSKEFLTWYKADQKSWSRQQIRNKIVGREKEKNNERTEEKHR